MKYLLALLCLTFAGCATMSPEQLDAEAEKIGYGAPPPKNWQEIVQGFMEFRLRDSMSAVYRFSGEPEKSWLSKAPISGGGLATAGYVVTAMINSKNSHGGYTGFRIYKFLFRDGKITYMKSDDWWAPADP